MKKTKKLDMWINTDQKEYVAKVARRLDVSSATIIRLLIEKLRSGAVEL